MYTWRGVGRGHGWVRMTGEVRDFVCRRLTLCSPFPKIFTRCPALAGGLSAVTAKAPETVAAESGGGARANGTKYVHISLSLSLSSLLYTPPSPRD